MGRWQDDSAGAGKWAAIKGQHLAALTHESPHN